MKIWIEKNSEWILMICTFAFLIGLFTLFQALQTNSDVVVSLTFIVLGVVGFIHTLNKY